MTARRLFTLAVAVLLLPLGVQAQAKKVLTQADWDQWRTISAPALSSDGKWAAYTLIPQVGDGELVIRATTGTTEYRVPRGYLGRPNNVPGGLRPPAANAEGEPTGPNAAPAQFTADSKYVIVTTQPNQAEAERIEREARGRAGRGGRGGRAGGAGNAATRLTLAIVNLADGNVTNIAGVRSFRLPRESGAWLAYVPEPDSAANADTAGRGGRAGAPRRTFGQGLVLRNMSTGVEEKMADVSNFAFDDSAKVLGYTVTSRDSTKDGAYLRTMATGATTTLASGRGDYKSLAFDRAGSQLLFLTDKTDMAAEKPRFTLYWASVKSGPAQPVVAPAAVPGGMHIADNANPSFTRSGNAITFGIAPQLPDSVPADSLVNKSVFDLWHYKDPVLQPTQKLNATRDRNRSFQAIYFPATKRVVQLANDSVPQVNVSDDARVAFASSRERYQVQQMWGDGGTDLYLIDPATGTSKLIREKISGGGQLSPDGKYVAIFNEGHWLAYNTLTTKTVDLTAPLANVHFDQETWDTPSPRASWGLAGWTKGDKTVLLYDRWDVWEMDPTGVKPPVMVTDSLGRKQHTVLRLVQAGGGRGGRGGRGGGANTNAERGVIDPAEPLLLRAFDEETKASGFYRDQLGVAKAPEKIVMGDVAYGNPTKAGDADQWIVTRGTFTDFPNLYTGPSLTQMTRISDANPQQANYNWGTVELVHWTSMDGFPLQGLLYKPENFDPTKKYPMIAYFYEQLSQNRHAYIAPNGRNVINPTHYVSNGYLIFEPDIHYEEGYPGPSAVKSIVPGVQMLLARGYVDPNALGLQGQSWGGYQTSYIITQTHMFSAAMAGAPVVNMTSAYGGIRWGSGLARAFQYEIGQSRIGASIWESPMRYFENSPLFWLDKVTTPLFIMSDDADDAVPWYQGIEFFVAMRRLGKEVYLINYNNDVHNPAGRANQRDIAMRMQQFFDNKLKSAPAPDWMVHGIPYLQKGRDQLGTPSGTPATTSSQTPTRQQEH
jgi:hypothetical protein